MPMHVTYSFEPDPAGTLARVRSTLRKGLRDLERRLTQRAEPTEPED
ncbi:hypothetical protein ACWDBW_14370 [Streptomyces sp. NPDC001107]